MRVSQKWITLPTCKQLRTCCASLFSLRVSLAAFFSLVLFVVDSSEAKTLYCARLLKVFRGQTESNVPAFDYCWYVSGSPQAADDYVKFPFLRDCNTSVGANGKMRFYPKPKNESNYDFYYVLGTTTTTTIPDDWTQDDVNQNVNESYQALPIPQRQAINGVICATSSQGDTISKSALFTNRAIGSPVGRYDGFSGVTTYDSSGGVIVSAPSSDGYIIGNELTSMGGTTPVFYRYDSANNEVIKLSGYESTTSDALSYDPSTGLYSFNQPNYDGVLGGIYATVSDLSQYVRNNPFLVDLKNPISIPSPEVTVNPEITVEPQVTVNPTVTVTPDVTVNVTAPTQNDITVAIDNSDVINSIDELAGQISDYTDESAEYNAQILSTVKGTSNTTTLGDIQAPSSVLSEEEQSLLSVVQGWHTDLPLIGDIADVSFDAFLGTIPDVGRDLVPLRGSIFGFDFVIDFSRYSTWISWFRAFILLLEIIWFYDALWRTVIQALQV